MSAKGSGGRVFASHYRPSVFFAPRPGFLFLPLVFIPGMALFKSVLIAGLATALVFVIATWLHSKARRGTPALQLSFASARIEGLGDLIWNDIASVRRVEDERGKPALEISLRNAPARVTPSPLWRPAGARTILLRTALLEDPIETIEEAFDFFQRIS
jgi:hypothetical protein